MFTSLKNSVRRAWRNPIALFLFSLVMFTGTETLTLVPMDIIFSGTITEVGFFEMPLAQFYLFFLLAPLEILRRTGLLPYIFFFLTIGVLFSCGQIVPRSRTSRVFNGTLVILQLGVFAVALYRIGATASPVSAIVALAFPLFYGTLVILLRKTIITHHPHGA